MLIMRQKQFSNDDMWRDIQDQLIDRIKVSGSFSIQLDESTDVVKDLIDLLIELFISYPNILSLSLQPKSKRQYNIAKSTIQ